MDTPLIEGIDPQQAMMENMAKMQGIVREMKEIPELPSEAPKDSNALLKVEFPDDGGILTYMEGFDLPYKGFPFFEMVDKIDLIKKVSRSTLSSLFHSFKQRNKFQLLLVALCPWLITDLVKSLLYTFYRVVERFRIKSIRYSDSIRELHRAFSVGEPSEIRLQLRDLFCMILEFDNAYRFRFQDIIVELDTVNLQKNPGKEIVRLLELMQSRETHQDVKNTWTLVTTFLPMFLFFNRNVKRELIEVLGAIDLEKVRLSPEDIQFATPRKDYQFGFKQ